MLIGKVIDNYRILEILGRGGMGIVYKAMDIALEKFVALKMIEPLLAQDESFLRRFRTEAKALAKLEDPNIVHVYALRETEFGLIMVMEYIEGKTLADLQEECGTIPFDEALYIFKQILKAIAHAHEVGVNHRDIKPRNMMITRQQAVKVMDFGLARFQRGPDSTVTRVGGGTLKYMSPEQVISLGSGDHRSDIYSIGMTFYDIIAGRTPFEENDSEFAIQKHIVEKKFSPPIKYNPSVPKDLNRIIMKAIEKEPSKRFQSAEEMLQAIEKYESSVVPPKKVGSKLSISKKPVYIMGSVVLLLFLLSLAFSNGTWIRNKINELFLAPKVALTITTQPAGAQIFINKQFIDKSPINNYLTKSGTLSLQIQKENHFTIDTSLVIRKTKPANFSFSLQPAAYVSIEVQPYDAMIVLDGSEIESSNLSNLELNVGTYTIRISSPGYNSIENKIRLAQGENQSLVYVLEPIDFKDSAILKITSVPSGASVRLNNRVIGATPHEDELEPGKYTISIRKDGYRDYSDTIIFQSGETITRDVRLNRLVGGIAITSEPRGASIFMNRQYQGRTPYTIRNVRTGNRQIMLQKEGFEKYYTTVHVDDNRVTPVQSELIPILGQLKILVIPWGNIYIDDKLKKKETGVQFSSDLPVGPHKVTIVHPNLGKWEKNVIVTEGKPYNLSIDFNRKVSLTVASEPIYSKIYIDNKDTGKVTPKTLKLRIGLHTIEVRREGYEAEKKTLNLEDDIKEPLYFRLKLVK